MHPDCGGSCGCYQRAFAEAARLIWRMPPAAASRTFKLRAGGGGPTSKVKVARESDNAEYQEALAYLTGPLGFKAFDAKLRLSGSSGTVEERLAHALREE